MVAWQFPHAHPGPLLEDSQNLRPLGVQFTEDTF